MFALLFPRSRVGVLVGDERETGGYHISQGGRRQKEPHAWTVSKVPKEASFSVGLISGLFTFFQMKKTFILCYLKN